MNWNDLTVRPQGARAKARRSPPARFPSYSSEGSHNNKNQNKKPLTQIPLQNQSVGLLARLIAVIIAGTIPIR